MENSIKLLFEVAPGWKVGKRETVAVYYDEIWYRGIAV